MKHISQTPAAQHTDGYLAPQPIPTPATTARRPRFDEDRMSPLMLSHSSDSWELCQLGEDDEGEMQWAILPTFSTLRIVPGINLVEMGHGKNPPSVDRMVAKARRGGAEVLEDANEYLYSLAGENGVGYFLFHERVKVYPNGRFDVQKDNAAWNRWRAELVESGRIEPPPDYAINDLRRRTESGINRTSASDHPSRKRMCADYTVRLEALDRLIAQMTKPAPEPAPAPKKPAAKAKAAPKDTTDG